MEEEEEEVCTYASVDACAARLFISVRERLWAAGRGARGAWGAPPLHSGAQLLNSLKTVGLQSAFCNNRCQCLPLMPPPLRPRPAACWAIS